MTKIYKRKNRCKKREYFPEEGFPRGTKRIYFHRPVFSGRYYISTLRLYFRFLPLPDRRLGTSPGPFYRHRKLPAALE